MTELLHEGTARGIAPEYTNKLIAASVAEAGLIPTSASAVSQITQLLPEPISDREIGVVLRLIEIGMLNREVKQKLFVAISTIEKHLENIYGKLSVNNRTQAITHARDLSSLYPPLIGTVSFPCRRTPSNTPLN